MEKKTEPEPLWPWMHGSKAEHGHVRDEVRFIEQTALTLAKIRRYHVHLGGLGADETNACCLVPVHAAQARAEIAIAQMRVSQRALLGSIHRRQQRVAGRVVVEKKRGRKMKRPAVGWSHPPGWPCQPRTKPQRHRLHLGSRTDQAPKINERLASSMSSLKSLEHDKSVILVADGTSHVVEKSLVF